ncbi:unnamed protein product, partial [Heterotrigona itama]
MALFLRLELEVDPLALPFGVVWRGAAAGGADCSPVAATATAADVRPPEVARPVRRNGPELAANRRANLRASRRARRAPAAPAPTLTLRNHSRELIRITVACAAAAVAVARLETKHALLSSSFSISIAFDAVHTI